MKASMCAGLMAGSNSEESGARSVLGQAEPTPENFVAAIKRLYPNDADIEELEDDLPRLGLVVLQFPKWTDGRAYSQAHLLRARYRFKGEVRAQGEVLVDMMPLLARTGFDAVVLRGDQKRESAQRALGFFAGHYQGDTLQPQPLFARAAA